MCSGNLLRQPFLQGYQLNKDKPKVDYLHFHGFFIGNNHLITNEEIDKLDSILYDFLKNEIMI